MDDHVKEIVIIRHPYPIVHLYDIVEHGRRYYRTQVFTSSTQRSLATISPRPFDNALLVPPPKEMSLVITRNLSSKLGVQTFIPKRHLHGLLPDALLRRYTFWQGAGDIIAGYPLLKKHRHLTNREGQMEDDEDPGDSDLVGFSNDIARYELRININHTSPPDKDGFGKCTGFATVERYALKLSASVANTVSSKSNDERETKYGSETKSHGNFTKNLIENRDRTKSSIIGIGANSVIDENQAPQILIDLLHGAPKSGPIRALCELALRLDTISSCLAWTEKSQKSSASVSGSVSLLEFPRLGLTFASRSGVNNVGHQICNLYSMEHTGLFISNIAATCVLTQKLLKGIPHAIVLERQDDGALYILVPATAKPNVRWCHGDGNTFTSRSLSLIETMIHG